MKQRLFLQMKSQIEWDKQMQWLNGFSLWLTQYQVLNFLSVMRAVKFNGKKFYMIFLLLNSKFNYWTNSGMNTFVGIIKISQNILKKLIGTINYYISRDLNFCINKESSFCKTDIVGR